MHAWTSLKRRIKKWLRPKIERELLKFKSLVDLLSGEWVLRFLPNGGTAVLIRTLQITSLTFIAVVAIRSRLHPLATWEPSWSQGRLDIYELLPLIGLIFAGVYAALYARFSAQWSYLANLYNQIMATATGLDKNDVVENKVMTKWYAGFIEDACDLHLFNKPMFAYVVASLLEKEHVRRAFIATVKDADVKLAKIERHLGRHFTASSDQPAITEGTAK